MVRSARPHRQKTCPLWCMVCQHVCQRCTHNRQCSAFAHLHGIRVRLFALQSLRSLHSVAQPLLSHVT